MRITGSWIIGAIETLGFHEQVRILGDVERDKVLTEVTAMFLKVPTATFWWSSLKLPHSAWPTEHGFRFIPQIVPTPNAAAWFITGLDDDDKAVFECHPAFIPALVGECPYFEYAVVDQSLKWMVIENHHDTLIATGQYVVERLTGMRG